MHKILPTDFLNFEFLRVLGTAPTKGADVGECLEVASKIKRDDPESWYRAWSDAAAVAEQAGSDAVHAGDRESALWAFMRASNYRRSSEFFLHGSPQDPRLLDAISKATVNFEKACLFLDSKVEHLQVPFEGGQLPANLFFPRAETRHAGKNRIPVIVNTGGFDTIQEELYHFTVSGARERGYATLTFEGPGQGLVLRRQDKMFLRGDWEVVISAVLDHLFHLAEQNPSWELDTSKVALIGNSMGGYFALRGATDSRIKACIAGDGFFDLGAAGRERTPAFIGYLRQDTADAIFNFVLRFNFKMRWEVNHGAFTFGTTSPSVAIEKFQSFTLAPQGQVPILQRIKCPVLVTHAPDSLYKIESARIYDGLTSLEEGKTKFYWEPKSAGQGSLQAKVGALAHLHAKIFPWLDDMLDLRREGWGAQWISTGERKHV